MSHKNRFPIRLDRYATAKVCFHVYLVYIMTMLLTTMQPTVFLNFCKGGEHGPTNYGSQYPHTKYLKSPH